MVDFALVAVDIVAVVYVMRGMFKPHHLLAEGRCEGACRWDLVGVSRAEPVAGPVRGLGRFHEVTKRPLFSGLGAGRMLWGRLFLWPDIASAMGP
ncbi:hypothetical protein [Streptomyces sp. NPDC006638]|uniref:hypothetical protein n=1 Tax=Streptomyces sp. NPDC006638 TaxID=3157183 RepID=UPI0033B292B3